MPPEIWQINPATGQGALLVSVSGAFNLTGIAEVTSRSRPHRAAPDCPETYIFGSSHIPAPLQVEPGSAKVWKLQFGANHSAAPTVSLLAAMPNAGFINGIAAWGKGRVLLGDTEAESVYLMDMDTGAYTTPLTGMTGINGIKTTTGYLYWANHAAQSLSRIPISSGAVAAGPAQVLAANQSIDDFAITVSQSGKGKAYIGSMYENSVLEVEVGPAPSSAMGAKRVVASNLSGTGTGLCTVVAFGRRPQDSHLLYATVGQGGGSASIVVLDPSQ